MKVLLLPVAKRELQKIHRYHERRALGLGDALLDDVSETLRRIKLEPSMLRPVARNLWRYRRARFRYGLLYTVDQDLIVVLTIGHLSRGPLYRQRAARRQ